MPTPKDKDAALLFTSRCLFVVHEQVDGVRQEVGDLWVRACQHRHEDDGVTSPLSQSSLKGRLHDIEE
jgi:hypothetical protein